jgi:hypothetical protein
MMNGKKHSSMERQKNRNKEWKVERKNYRREKNKMKKILRERNTSIHAEE